MMVGTMTIVAAKREGVIRETHSEEGAVAGAIVRRYESLYF